MPLQTPVVDATPRAVSARVQFLFLLLLGRRRRRRRRSRRRRRRRAARLLLLGLLLLLLLLVLLLRVRRHVRRPHQRLDAQRRVALVGLGRRRLTGEGGQPEVRVDARRCRRRRSHAAAAGLILTGRVGAGHRYRRAALHGHSRVEGNLRRRRSRRYDQRRRLGRRVVQAAAAVVSAAATAAATRRLLDLLQVVRVVPTTSTKAMSLTSVQVHPQAIGAALLYSGRDFKNTH